MIQNSTKEQFRTPRCITSSEANSLIDWIIKMIENHIKSNHCKSVSVKDLFGWDNYDWGEKGFPIQVLYDNRLEQYTEEGYSDPSEQAIRQAGIDLGWLFKSACRNMKTYTFKLKRVYKQTIYTIV